MVRFNKESQRYFASKGWNLAISGMIRIQPRARSQGIVQGLRGNRLKTVVEGAAAQTEWLRVEEQEYWRVARGARVFEGSWESPSWWDQSSESSWD